MSYLPLRLELIAPLLVLFHASTAAEYDAKRLRLRDLGVEIGVLQPGPTNTLTDVAGVQVGHASVIDDLPDGGRLRTGVTAILPHEGNIFLQKVPAAVHVANGFGKLLGSSQVTELGQLETPILLTNTLSAPAVADALVGWTLKQPGCELVRSVNAVVGECNDGYLNDIRRRGITSEHVLRAITSAHGERVEQGCVGAGVGTTCMGWKGGIGSSSRKLPDSLGGYTIGVLVQTNFGGSLTIDGVPVGRRLGRYYLKDELGNQEHGSCMMVVATDAPLDARQLARIARRAPLGLAAAGSSISHGSGDFVIAFSTAEGLQSAYESPEPTQTVTLLRDDRLSPLFEATKDATNEAVIDSMLQATTITGHQGHMIDAIDLEQLRPLLDERPKAERTR